MNNFEEKQRIKTAYTYISELLGNENFDWNTQVKVSDVYNILQEAMKDVAVAQRYADAIFAVINKIFTMEWIEFDGNYEKIRVPK